MGIIDFSVNTVPDIDAMELPALRAYQEKIRAAITELDQKEPRDEDSEEYEHWSEQHEDLEDILDDILDRMDELENL